MVSGRVVAMVMYPGAWELGTGNWGGGAWFLVPGSRFLLDEGVADVPEVALALPMLHLQVGEGGLTAGAPVDDAFAPIDEAVVVEADEGGANGLLGTGVHGEALAGPVAGGAQAAELSADLSPVLVNPGPDALQELISPQLVPVQAFRRQLPLHHVLGGDGGMILAGEPERRLAAHAVPAGEDVFQGDEHGAPQVEVAGDVGRRHDDGEGLSLRVDARREVAALLPEAVQPLLHRSRVVGLGDVAAMAGLAGHGLLRGTRMHRPRQFGAVKSRFYRSP